MSWTEPAESRLRELWAAGKSASQILLDPDVAATGTTRNGVIGKVHRLGLSGRDRAAAIRCRPKLPAEQLRDPARAARPTLATSPMSAENSHTNSGGGLQRKLAALADADEIETPTEAVDLPTDQSEFAVSFRDVNEKQCRWPIGNPSDLDTFRFCGAPKRATKGCWYCSRHDMASSAGFGRRVEDPSRRGRHAQPFAANPTNPFN